MRIVTIKIKNISLDSLEPKDHIIRKVDFALDLFFDYEKVSDLYSDIRTKSIDPVFFLK